MKWILCLRLVCSYLITTTLSTDHDLPFPASLKTNDGGGGDRLGMRGDSFRQYTTGLILRAILIISWIILGDRAQFPPREDLPLPTQPPYTAFVGNLAFDLTDTELEEFFSPLKVCS